MIREKKTKSIVWFSAMHPTCGRRRGSSVFSARQASITVGTKVQTGHTHTHTHTHTLLHTHSSPIIFTEIGTQSPFT